MKKIFILGSSAATVQMIETIRANDQESTITLFSTDGFAPYDRAKFPDFLSGKIKLEDLNLRDEQFYKTHRVDVVLDQTITRINLKRQKIHTEQKVQYDYDVLFASDLPTTKFIDLPGVKKDGVYGLRRLDDIKRIEEYAPLIDTVVIESDTISGFQAAVALAKRKREIYLIISKDHFLARSFDDERCENVYNALEELGVKVIRNNNIAEILGEGDLRAVRLESGKVLSTQIVILSSQYADLRLLQDQIEIDNFKIPTTEYFQTSIDGFYAFDQLTSWTSDSIANEEFIGLEYLEKQGQALGSLFTTEQQEASYSQFSKKITFGNYTINVFGEYWLQDGLTKKVSFNELTGATEICWLKDGVLKSSVLINAQEKYDEYYGLINQKFEVSPSAESIKLNIEDDLCNIKKEQVSDTQFKELQSVANMAVEEVISQVNEVRQKSGEPIVEKLDEQLPVEEGNKSENNTKLADLEEIKDDFRPEVAS